MLVIIEILCGLIIFLLYYYFTATFNFWKKRNIPGPQPALFFGTMKNIILGRTILAKYLKSIYDAYEDAPFVGIFNMREPILLIKDPEHIKNVLIKDSALFSSRGLPVYSKAEPWNNFLFFADGPMAHVIRTRMSTIFTPSKIKEIYHTMLESLERLDIYLEESLPRNDHMINCSELGARLTADIIGNNLMGINMTTLTTENFEKNDFIRYSNMTRGTNWSIIVKVIMQKTFPRLYNQIGYYFFNHEEVNNFYVNFLLEIMEYRKKHGIIKPDVVGLLMEIKENPGKLSEITGSDVSNEFLASYIFGFFYAGYETAASTICNTLYELAFHPNIQDKLRKEILDTYAKNNGQLLYDHINTMPYLNAVFKETLRKYPPADSVQREVSTSYTFKNTDINVPKKQKVIISIHALHHDSKLYPNPDIYDPDRFIDEMSHPRDPMHYLPFGHGPRNCIGERLGILQSKVGLIGILRNYKIDVCEKTVTSYGYVSHRFVTAPSTDIFIKMTKAN
ncbi:PREDICTED: cytochrome P450 6B1-like [Dinoponera quadriceps]|uniref:Cytochrome P450 6B1-like n=1 Tax=Dinoponera quadriceps TaxID=609295 RepID=A0A6P3WW37_DINQU|nr:PREDICTED: cytochrome P450 6B1-like [Dinoponera quadriceps]XP_014470369.1 PREDICTED: cytochrome P450 6B1-like [Dinoponera quadriceps]XP_014470370.1 PREDICTED: cytochrome P450 6B1-like [Dinoponera quadriceps]